MKKTFTLFLIFISLIINNTNLFCQEPDKSVTITTSGSGKTKDEAIQIALRSAIEQAFGAFISTKTEILNDKIIVDQMVAVSNGNIKSFSVLNESKLLDGSWGVTLKAKVSVNKLMSFVESKGISIEIKGGLFALNIKQQLLNEQGEINAICEMVGLLHESMQISFDYVIKINDPKSLDTESKNWEIPLEVTATTNKNIDFCANYCIKTLEALTLSSEEVISYGSLNKEVFYVNIYYKGVAKKIFLRKKRSLDALVALFSNSGFYYSLFTVQSGIEISNGNDKKENGQSHDFCDYLQYPNNIGISFLTSGQQAASFKWADKRTLAQIEQMTGYKVKPRGVVSQFKYGGFVVYEENGHGLVAAIIDLENSNWNSAKTACDDLILNGYGDWYLPTKDELNRLFVNLQQYNVGGFNSGGHQCYWSSTIDDFNNAHVQIFSNGRSNTRNRYDESSEYKFCVRAVRTF